MLPDRVSNPGPLTYESGALPIALRGPAIDSTFINVDSMFQAQQVRDNFSVHKWGNGERLLLAACVGPLNGHCSMAAISGKDSPTHAASNSRSPFPHLCTEKLSRTCCACSRGGALFLPYRIQPGKGLKKDIS